MRARIDGRARAYSSRESRSAALRGCAMPGSDAVGDAEQPQWRGRLAFRRREPAFNLVPLHRAIARVKIGLCGVHLPDHRSRDLHPGLAVLALDRIALIMPRAA